MNDANYAEAAFEGSSHISCITVFPIALRSFLCHRDVLVVILVVVVTLFSETGSHQVALTGLGLPMSPLNS